MKIIWENLTEGISADVEDSDYPAGNLLDAHSKKRWKAGATSATLTATCADGSNALALCNVYADSVDISVDGGTPETVTLLQDDGYGEYRLENLFLSYTAVSGSHTVELDLSMTGDNVAAGIFFSGKSYDWTNPNWGVGTGAASQSIVLDMDNGFDYIFQRNLNKTPNMRLNTHDKTEYFNFLRWSREIFPNPFVLYVEDFSDELVYYARMMELPKPTLTSVNKYQISFSLKEYL